MMTTQTVERTMPEFSGGHAVVTRLEKEWYESHAELDAYVLLGTRHSQTILLLYDGKNISQLEQTLGRSFQREVAAMKALPAMAVYLRNISKFTPAARTARLAEIENSKQNLLDKPDEKSLERYQKALAAKISKVESDLFAAQHELGLTDQTVETDQRLILEAETLEKELANGALAAAEKGHADGLQKMTELRAALLATGVNVNTDREWQQLVFKTNQVGNEKAKLQLKAERLSELRTFEIICHDCNK